MGFRPFVHRLATELGLGGSVENVAGAVLIELAAWREREAQARDVPRSRVLKDDAVMDIVTAAPRTVEALGQLRRVGGADDGFSPEAVATLARFAGGVPRTVVTLARLALVAAAGDAAEQVDAATVERVWRELAPTWADDRQHDESAAAASAAPRFQVVRRLWG